MVLLTLPETGGEFSSPATAEVLLADGRTRYAFRELMYTHYYRFGGRVDSTGRVGRAFTLSHQIDYDQNSYKYYDAFAIRDTNFFNRFPALLTDDRGVRYFATHESVENSFRLSTFKLASGNFQGERRQRDFLEAGITHRHNRLYMEPTSAIVNNLMLTGKVGLRLGERMRLQADGLLCLLDQAGDFRIKGLLEVDLRKAGTFSIAMRNQLYSPTWVQNNLTLFQQTLYQTNFSKTVENSLSATYALPKRGFSATGRYHLLNNYIYFGAEGLPIQRGTPIGVWQLSAQKDFRFGKFTLANRAVLQQTEGEVLRLPALFAKHSLVYEGRWFGVLLAQLGADVRYTTAFKADYYNPVVGQFQLQDEQEVTFFPNVDVYFSMKVSTFRAFIKGENLTTLFQPDERLFLSSLYPWPAAAIRWGVSWKMLD
ncbi:MAG: putative porin [Saprospiraceae bacterium]